MDKKPTPSAWVIMLSAAAILAITMGARQSVGLFVSPINLKTAVGCASSSCR